MMLWQSIKSRLQVWTTLLFVVVVVGCGYGPEAIPKGREIGTAIAPDGYSRAFVWYPDLTGLGATVSQPYQVWIQYLRGDGQRKLIFEAEETNGVKLTWRTTRQLEICYGPSHIYKFLSFFEYGERHSQQTYEVEVVLRKMEKLADC